VISFRYHLVTIVAVFLALGLGLLAGTTVVEPGLVRTLRNRTDSLLVQVNDLRGQVEELSARVGQQERAGDVLPALATGALAGVPVVIVTQSGVEGALLSQTRRAMDVAGADVVAVLSVTELMAASDKPTQQQLARILGFPASDPPSDLAQRAAVELGRRLASGVARPIGAGPEVDVLGAMLSEGFLDVPPGSPGITDATLPDIGGKGQVIVVVAGTEEEVALDPQDFMVPLVNELVRRSAPVAAGESVSTAHPFVLPLRMDGAARDGDRMVTVDDLDLNMGGTALALGLERLLSTGQGGNYGIKTGASGPIPSR